MKTNFKLATVAMVMVGMVVRANGAQAQESGASQMARVSSAFVPEAALYVAPPQTDADQIIRISGASNVPEAALFWPKSSTQETVAAQIARVSGIMVPEAALFLDPSATVVRELTPPTEPVSYIPLNETDAQQIMRVSGAHNVPEAALNWPHFYIQESGASQIKRVSGGFIPEAALYLGGSAPAFDTVTVASAASETTGN